MSCNLKCILDKLCTVKSSDSVCISYVHCFVIQKDLFLWQYLQKPMTSLQSPSVSQPLFKVSDASSNCHCPRRRTPNLTCSPFFFSVTQERCPAVTHARGHQCSTYMKCFASVKYSRMSLQSTASKIPVNVMPHITQVTVINNICTA